MSEEFDVKMPDGRTVRMARSENFILTPHLRWALKDSAATMPKLQQLLQGDRGTQRWEDVPAVVTPEAFQ
jgi:hypothetical protein